MLHALISLILQTTLHGKYLHVPFMFPDEETDTCRCAMACPKDNSFIAETSWDTKFMS
jgi:hypothetical protein